MAGCLLFLKSCKLDPAQIGRSPDSEKSVYFHCCQLVHEIALVPRGSTSQRTQNLGSLNIRWVLGALPAPGKCLADLISDGLQLLEILSRGFLSPPQV